MLEQKNDIKNELCNIYSQVLERELSMEDFGTTTGLLEKFHIDSLIALQIVVKIEQVFGIIIEDDNVAIEMLDSLDKAVDFIEHGSQG
ncbi:hypothetical protein acsn021_24140 [Anaerocolumna cellulosilytica]|uniref:Uncharacterized protein n=1 Tax=Anaerocolumna cellulosilytica TaxID=433286 RepID=A0A6S6R6A4_9FIRM|nr:phosphopantetheine-binding protein [Anaerocolumna cellulosilytica]MBB5193941.1 acyl carrier protein [Anaerocolumna cellulosilytica]BCJ94845.1 hypothetical protein acsn021_24140 [Anaerocolumna cellulosilytica]